VEWPPSPWRILRALAAAWKLLLADEPASSLERLLSALAARPPVFHLPPHRHSHTRHYVVSGDARRLMIDAFVAVEREEPLALLWPELDLDGAGLELLDRLLAGVRYLGRAESWCRAWRSDREWAVNARPLLADEEAPGRTVTVLCARPGATLEQIMAGTFALRKRGVETPPGARWVSYRMNGLEERCTTAAAPRPRCLTLALYGEGRIRTEHGLLLADRLRRQLLRQEATLSPTLLGKRDGVPRREGHLHLHILPEGTGFLERVRLWAAEGFSQEDLAALGRLRHLPATRGWAEVGLLLWDAVEGWPESPARIWVSLTPYLPTRHQGLEEEVARECSFRGLPAPEVLSVEEGARGFKLRRPGGPAPAGAPVWLRLRFPEAVGGPLSLGGLSHFGMGRLVPEAE
jgi:CRISPR-associated protein Csb2